MEKLDRLLVVIGILVLVFSAGDLIIGDQSVRDVWRAYQWLHGGQAEWERMERLSREVAEAMGRVPSAIPDSYLTPSRCRPPRRLDF